MLKELAELGTPVVGAAFKVWQVRESKASNLTHGWAVGARLGTSADGSFSQTPLTPPGARRLSIGTWDHLSSRPGTMGSLPRPWPYAERGPLPEIASCRHAFRFLLTFGPLKKTPLFPL